MPNQEMDERAKELLTQIAEYNTTAEPHCRVTEGTMDALARELVDADIVSAMDPQDWARLNVSIGEKKALLRFAEKKDKKDLWRPISPPSIKFNIASWVGAVILMTPPLVLGLMREEDQEDGGYSQSGMTILNVTTNIFSVMTTDDDGGFGDTSVLSFGGDARGGQVLLPAVALIGLTSIIGAQTRLALGKDMLQEASPDISVREAQRSNLTNSGVVGALLLTVVLAMLQSDPPVDQKWRLISQWYLIFTLVGMLYCFIATALSVILLMYIEPLNDDASYMFVNAHIDYFGEPVMCIIMAVLMFMYSATLWIFGQYEMECGLVSYFACVLCIQRVLLTYAYSSTWVNELLDPEEVELRKTRGLMNTILNANCSCACKAKFQEHKNVLPNNTKE